ncbi:heat-stable enterotoxin receptor isoform X1 [Acanthopagrus latus]|uniref:heat-stable enterotoxin receptor isoform X1 n=1 Tax=Acanthopagrus latus TaxID=8177 RepID=UPI00187BF811|nr:heat-stable enterotoxin receptor isoform X1 [Acanthopagrus latus]
MRSSHCLFYLGMLIVVVVANKMLDDCLSWKRKYTMNVVLLEDNTYAWSRPFVEEAVKRAIEEDRLENIKHDLNFTLTANYNGFNTTLYNRQGCGSSTCEGVAIFKKLHNDGEIGCVMLGPSCTYATYQLVDANSGLTLSIPVISAGSFGLSCDYQPKVTRILPPARKISDLLFHFIRETLSFKTAWERTYVYKKPHNVSEDCFWYINGLEAASANFAKNGKREMLRAENDMISAVIDEKRHSNIFIMCGSPEDIISLKSKVKGKIPEEIVFILIDVYNPDYYINTTSTEGMENVLVITLPPRNYTSGSNSTYNNTINDYVAGYHDGALLFGKVLRERMLARQRGSADVPLSYNPFGNASFYGMGGHYVLDEYGDRDVNFSVIYTSKDNKYEILAVFDTSINKTTYESENPSLTWTGGKLPSDVPKKSQVLNLQDVIMIVLSFSVIVVTAIALIFYRQNRRERLLQKKWSHIDPHLIGPLDEKEVSLKIDDDKRKDSTYFRHRGRYDKKPVILKELKQADGDFSEDQRIELNTLLRIDYYNLTKFYGTVKFEYAVFGVFELCQRGSLRHILSDKISYPDETFMDTEFKISVMYDIAKGMSYLHSSNIQVHGRLKSTNCVVDNRMVVKITDFGCHTILNPGRDLWTAPEHLRKDGVSQKGDVYSYAIIAHEIIHRKTPFYTQFCSNPTEKLYRVQFPMGMGYFRPDLNFDGASEGEVELYMLIKNCWDEDPERRPDFKRIELSLGKIFSNLHNQATETYMDNLIRRLQMYSRTLEHLVEERTSLYKAERDRADRLNFMLLPGPVVRSLKETGKVKPELFEEVTIYFSDIVGFTTLCHYSTPMEVVDMLNDIYKNFDSILDHHDVYKVETIGDAYMVASGLPKRNGDRHAVDIALMALDMLAFVGSFELLHLPGIPLWIRIGVHSGPCAAGVVGNKMPRYCLFGDTVNTASRMESTGLPLRIHISQSTINILQRTDCQVEYEQRGETYLKGKGKEMTYWLTGITGAKYNLPTPPTAENFQRLQQDLAEMIVSSLEKREDRSLKKTLSTKVHERETNGSLQGDSSPEYFHLAVTDSPSTLL